MSIIFNAIGSPRSGVWFVLQRVLISLVSIVVYAVLLYSGMAAHFALLGCIVTFLLASKLRRYSEPQHFNARNDGEGNASLSGNFAEGRVSVLKRQKLVSVETSADRLLLHCRDEGTPRNYSIDSTSFPADSLQMVSALLSAVVEGRNDIDTMPELGQVRKYENRGHRILNFHQKPSYLMLTWVSLAVALAVLYAGIWLIHNR